METLVKQFRKFIYEFTKVKGKIMVENKKTQEYNADQIQVLEGLEAVG